MLWCESRYDKELLGCIDIEAKRVLISSCNNLSLYICLPFETRSLRLLNAVCCFHWNPHDGGVMWRVGWLTYLLHWPYKGGPMVLLELARRLVNPNPCILFYFFRLAYLCICISCDFNPCLCSCMWTCERVCICMKTMGLLYFMCMSLCVFTK